LLTIYKDLHTHPELSTHEERSSAIVAKELKLAGCEVTEHVGKYEKPGATCFGVIGVMKNGAGPTVLVRTDLDALPVHEETGVPYASTVTTKSDDGKIRVAEGYVYANVDSVDVTVRGIGRHGAYPHKTKDPIVLSAEMINAWQTIASRENNPIDPLVITVGSIHGGTKHNIIPDEVKMQLTVRTYKKEVRDKVLAAIDSIAKGCAIAAGLPPDKMPEVHVRQDESVPATYNNPELTRRVTAALKVALGSDKIIAKDPTMGAEDFCE